MDAKLNPILLGNYYAVEGGLLDSFITGSSSVRPFRREYLND